MASLPSPFIYVASIFIPVFFFFTRIPCMVLLLLLFVNRSIKVLCLVEAGCPEQVIFIFPVKTEVIILPDKLLSLPYFCLISWPFWYSCRSSLTCYSHVPGKLQDSGVTGSSCQRFHDMGLLSEPQSYTLDRIFPSLKAMKKWDFNWFTEVQR